jgi:hypothetical protein
MTRRHDLLLSEAITMLKKQQGLQVQCVSNLLPKTLRSSAQISIAGE